MTSDTVILNTGAPQGCVLSPVLFSLHTNEMKIMNSPCQLYKYADDMVLVGLMQTGYTVNQSTFFHHIGELTMWCEDYEAGYFESPQCLPLFSACSDQ